MAIVMVTPGQVSIYILKTHGFSKTIWRCLNACSLEGHFPIEIAMVMLWWSNMIGPFHCLHHMDYYDTSLAITLVDIVYYLLTYVLKTISVTPSVAQWTHLIVTVTIFSRSWVRSSLKNRFTNRTFPLDKNEVMHYKTDFPWTAWQKVCHVFIIKFRVCTWLIKRLHFIKSQSVLTSRFFCL